MVCRSLGHSLSADDTLAKLSQQLDATYRTVATKLLTNSAARIETREGKEELVVAGLEKLEEPPSLLRLRAAFKTRLPRVDLPELLLEIAAHTGFAMRSLASSGSWAIASAHASPILAAHATGVWTRQRIMGSSTVSHDTVFVLL
jgi:hypothetical protein